MESPPPLSCCLSKKSKKRMFSGTSSTCVEGADVVEIPPPVNLSSNSKLRKEDEEVLCPEIIDVDDDDETWSKLKADTSDKGKQPSANCSSAGIHHYPTGNNVKSSEKSYVNGSNNLNEIYNEIIDIDDEDMEFSSNQPFDDRYARLQSRFDELDIPPGIEVPVPWFMDDEVNYLGSTSTTYSDSQILFNHVGSPSWKAPSPSLWLEGEHVKKTSTSGSSLNSHIKFDMLPYFGTLQSSSSNDSSKYPTKVEAPKAFGDWATSDSKKKPLSPHDKFLSGSAKLSTKMEVPKAFGYWEASDLKRKHLTPRNKFQSSSKNKYSSTVESKVHKGVTPTDIGYFHGQGLVGEGGMNTNVDLSQNVQGHYYGDWDSSISTHYLSEISDSSGPPFFTFDDQTDYTSTYSDFMLYGDPDAGNSLSPSGPSSCERVYDDPEVSLKKFDLFKRFDTVEDHSDHLFSNHAAVNQPSKGWAKKIQDEWRILEKDLPETIFVRVYESRMDLLRAVIIGAEGTPYHDGLFFFDMFFPQSYPNIPPRVKYHSGGLRINPNLYNCGKVCLSLLNTWSGSKKEMWTPGVSTVLQILVSIQGLILNAKPYFNEPGYANFCGTPSGEISSLQYNERTLIYSLKTMVYSIRKPPKHFEDFITGHFLKRADDILVACKAYLNGAQVGCLVKGGVQDVEAGNKSCSDAFKKDLATCLKTLVNAFAQVGVKDCEKFLAELECLPAALQVTRQGCSFLH